ncbi:MAG TPA: hypothetical protein VHG09_09455 [Longimicrobiales bacterium]|nr:hypothetical protein [Longimicrobiales bacterium]
MGVVVATDSEVIVVDPESGDLATARGLAERPTCLAADPLVAGRLWCGVRRRGVFRSEDGGTSWVPAGLDGRLIMALATTPDVVWAGTEPSELWRSVDGGESWERMESMESLPSSSEWAFPPRPETHHVRWIAPHPSEPDRLWVAIEAGALVSSHDGGRTWHDRVTGGPYDTHELAIHPSAPDTLRVSAGDGYFESEDAGATWSRPRDGLDVGYLRSVAIDPGRPDTIVVSAASGPRTAYVAGRSDGRLYRRAGGGDWERVTAAWPDPPNTIAPLLTPDSTNGRIWAADERGLHVTEDGGTTWQQVAAWPAVPNHLRGAVVDG